MDCKDFDLEDWVNRIYELIRDEEPLDKNEMRYLLLSLIDFLLTTLNQESVLNKAKSKIKQMDFDFGDYYDHTNEIIEKVLEVIDKCMEESE